LLLMAALVAGLGVVGAAAVGEPVLVGVWFAVAAYDWALMVGLEWAVIRRLPRPRVSAAVVLGANAISWVAILSVVGILAPAAGAALLGPAFLLAFALAVSIEAVVYAVATPQLPAARAWADSLLANSASFLTVLLAAAGAALGGRGAWAMALLGALWLPAFVIAVLGGGALFVHRIYLTERGASTPPAERRDHPLDRSSPTHA